MAGTLIPALRRQVNSVCCRPSNATSCVGVEGRTFIMGLYDVCPPFYVGKFLINF